MKKEVVITGLGVLTSVGIEKDAFWTALIENRSGIDFLNIETSDDKLRPMGSTVPDFRAKDYVSPRKNIKVMTEDIQLGYVAACLAVQDAGLTTKGDSRNVDPERMGVVFGSDLIGTEIPMLLGAYRAGIKDGKYDFSRWGTDAMKEIFPLWMLKFLPNMPACQISICHDARGPSNSITLCRCSSLAAITEAAKAIERGAADVMIAGGVGNRINQDFLTRARSYGAAPRREDPTTVPRPFDADRCGCVLGEGSGAFTLESREFAEARGARIYATIRGFAAADEPKLHDSKPTGESIRRSIRLALKDADLKPEDVGFVNAEGLGGDHEDRIEAQAIRDMLGDVAVSANKGNFGDLGSGTGAVELAATLISLETGVIPPVRNCENPAKDCPVNVVVKKPEAVKSSVALKLNQTWAGRSFALIVQK